LVAKAIEKDHRGLDSANNTLSKSYFASDLLQTARATAAALQKLMEGNARSAW
jgi:hypothetical protein